MTRIFEPAITRIISNIGAVLFFTLFISACASSVLSPGLTDRMDLNGANLDRAEALNLINQYRATRGVLPLSVDPVLDATAQQLAVNYAANSNRPQKPDTDIVQMQLSAGYTNFANVFSGWRGSASDATAIADPQATRAGFGVVYSANSTYGVYWVLLLGGPEEQAILMQTAQ